MQVMGVMVMPQRVVIKKFPAQMDELKTIQAQDELLKTMSVKTVVQTSVKEGIKSYSSALGGCMSAQSAPPQKMLQEVVNDVIQVEERSRLAGTVLFLGWKRKSEKIWKRKLDTGRETTSCGGYPSWI